MAVPGPLHVADITYVRPASGSFAYVAFVTDAYARRIAGWAVSTGRRARDLPLIALDQSITWTALHGNTQGPIHHSDHGTQYIGTLYGTHLNEHGILASTCTVGDSRAFAPAETADGVCRSEPIRRSRPFDGVQALEQATFHRVSRCNHERSHEHPGHRTPAEIETRHHQSQVTPVTQ